MGQTKLVPRDLSPTSREAGIGLPLRAEPAPNLMESSEIKEPTTAVDAVRYLFLARELRCLGQAQAADRWQAQAMAWMERFSSSSDKQ